MGKDAAYVSAMDGPGTRALGVMEQERSSGLQPFLCGLVGEFSLMRCSNETRPE